MNYLETRRCEVLDRVQTFGTDNAIGRDDCEGAGSTAAAKRLMKEVNYLDATIHNKYARNADKLHAWESASHIEHAPQREKKPALPAIGITLPKPTP